MLVGEAPGPDGELRTVDLAADTLAALRGAGVEVVARSSQEVLIVAGGTCEGSIEHYNAGGGCMVTTLQLDDQMFVIGQDDFTIVKMTVDDWCGEDSSENFEEFQVEGARTPGTFSDSFAKTASCGSAERATPGSAPVTDRVSACSVAAPAGTAASTSGMPTGTSAGTATTRDRAVRRVLLHTSVRLQ